MDDAVHSVEFHFSPPASGCRNNRPTARKPSLLRRIVETLVESDQSRNDRAMAGFLAGSGGRFTDAMEREAFRRQLGSNVWFE
jgi:hypothetical protein